MGRARPPGEAKVGARRGRDKQGTVCLSVHRDCDVMEKSRGAGTRLQARLVWGQAGRQASNLLMELEGGGRRPAAAAAAQAECLNRTGGGGWALKQREGGTGPEKGGAEPNGTSSDAAAVLPLSLSLLVLLACPGRLARR